MLIGFNSRRPKGDLGDLRPSRGDRQGAGTWVNSSGMGRVRGGGAGEDHDRAGVRNSTEERN